VHSVEIGPLTWCCLVVYLVLCALLDIFAQSSAGPASGGHRRALGSTSVDSAAINYVPILTILISTSWVACCVQFWVWYMLRVSQRVLLQQKLCMHGWSSELAGKLVDQNRTILLEKKKAEEDELAGVLGSPRTLRSDGPRPRETGEIDGLALDNESHCFSKSFEENLLFATDINHMWVCFGLSYYTLDLGAMIENHYTYAQGVTAERVAIHVAFLLPHVLLALVLMPNTHTQQSLLSCVVRINETEVTSVQTKMEMGEREMKELRVKLIEWSKSKPASHGDTFAANKQEEVNLSVFSTGQIEREIRRRQAASQPVTATLNTAARRFYKHLARAADEGNFVMVAHLRTGLRSIGIIYTAKEWLTMMRLMDRDHSHSITEEEFIAVLQPNMGHWRDAHKGMAGVVAKLGISFTLKSVIARVRSRLHSQSVLRESAITFDAEMQDCTPVGKALKEHIKATLMDQSTEQTARSPRHTPPARTTSPLSVPDR